MHPLPRILLRYSRGSKEARALQWLDATFNLLESAMGNLAHIGIPVIRKHCSNSAKTIVIYTGLKEWNLPHGRGQITTNQLLQRILRCWRASQDKGARLKRLELDSLRMLLFMRLPKEARVQEAFRVRLRLRLRLGAKVHNHTNYFYPLDGSPGSRRGFFHAPDCRARSSR